MKGFGICRCWGEHQPPLARGETRVPDAFLLWCSVAEPGGRPGASDDPGERAGRGGEHPPENQQEPLRLLRSHHHQTSQMKRHPLPSHPSASPCPAPGEEPARPRAPAHADVPARLARLLASACHTAHAGAFACSAWRPFHDTGLRQAQGLQGCCVRDNTGTVFTPIRRSVPAGADSERPAAGGASPALREGFRTQLLLFPRLFP